MLRSASKIATYEAMRRQPKPIPRGYTHCQAQHCPCGNAELEPLRRLVGLCAIAARAHTAKHNPGQPLSPGDGGRVTIPDVALHNGEQSRLIRARVLDKKNGRRLKNSNALGTVAYGPAKERSTKR